MSFVIAHDNDDQVSDTDSPSITVSTGSAPSVPTTDPSTVRDLLTDSTTTFPSRSSAHIARLRLEHRLSVPVIDLFLRIIRDPEFRADELTFREAADVDLYVAERRREAGDDLVRSMAFESEGVNVKSRAATLPYPILNGILDAIANDPTLYDEPINFQSHSAANANHNAVNPDGSHPPSRNAVFGSLALVHRSWTVPCQQCLASRIMVRSAATLIKLLRSPIVVRGATTELVISLGALWNRGFYFLEDAVSSPTGGGDAATWGDIEFDIVCLMRRMPNLRKLHMLESGLHESLVLSQVGQARSLRSLTWLRAHGYPDCDFALLCATLNRLPNLKELEISGWTFRSSLGHPFLETPPTFELSSLSVAISPGERLVGQVGWLIQALERNNGNAKLRLDVTLVARFSTKEILRVFPLCEDSLASLGVLHIVNKGGFEETNLDEMRAFLTKCTGVKKLHVQSKNVSILEFLDVLPSSVEELRYSWFDMWAMPWSIVEAHMPRLISSETALPKLRRLTINNYEVPFYHLPPRSVIEAEGHPAPKTQAACDEQGVELELTSQFDWRDA